MTKYLLGASILMVMLLAAACGLAVVEVAAPASDQTTVDEAKTVDAAAAGLNDKSETRAIKKAFGKHAYDLALSSPKSMLGHLLGAAGAMSGLTCVKAIETDVLPPTINLDNPDPECDLDYIPNVARPRRINVAMANGFGFGGQNAVVVMKRFED